WRHKGLRLALVWALGTLLLCLVAKAWLGFWPAPTLVAALALVAWDCSLGSLIVATGVSEIDSANEPSTATAPVSVLIAAYNEAACIAATVRSVLAQDGVDFEVLVGDDGSVDQTRAVVEREFAGDPRVRVLTQAHAGKAPMLNRLLAAAKHPIV